MTKNWNARSAKFSISNRPRSSSSSICCVRSTARRPTTATSVGSMISIQSHGKKRTRLKRSREQQRYEDVNDRTENRTGLESRRHWFGGLGSERDFNRGEGNAGINGDPRKIRAAKASGEPAHYRAVAHDGSNRGVD